MTVTAVNAMRFEMIRTGRTDSLMQVYADGMAEYALWMALSLDKQTDIVEAYLRAMGIRA